MLAIICIGNNAALFKVNAGIWELRAIRRSDRTWNKYKQTPKVVWRNKGETLHCRLLLTHAGSSLGPPPDQGRRKAAWQPRHRGLGGSEAPVGQPLGLWCLLTLSTHTRKKYDLYNNKHLLTLMVHTVAPWLHQKHNFPKINTCLTLDNKYYTWKRMICIHIHAHEDRLQWEKVEYAPIPRSPIKHTTSSNKCMSCKIKGKHYYSWGLQ